MAQIPTNGLVAHWNFKGNANDLSGNGNNGVVYSATLYSVLYNTKFRVKIPRNPAIRLIKSGVLLPESGKNRSVI